MLDIDVIHRVISCSYKYVSKQLRDETEDNGMDTYVD